MNQLHFTFTESMLIAICLGILFLCITSVLILDAITAQTKFLKEEWEVDNIRN